MRPSIQMAFVLSCSLSALGIAADSNAVPRELGPSDWASIQKAYEAARLELHSSASGATGHNPGQRWRSHFDGRGVLVEPNHGAWTWGLELSGYGRGSDWVNVTTPTRTITNGATSTYVWDDRLEEWYVNERRGLEHGFTLRSRPSGDASDDLRIDLEVRGDSVPRADADARGVTFCDGDGVARIHYSGLLAFDADGRTLPARLVASEGTVQFVVEDRHATYPITIDPIAQQAYLKASNCDAGDTFGHCVAISGDTVAIGSFGEDGAATGVNGNEADNSADGAGAVYVFVRSGSTWTQQAYVKASNTEAFDAFGSSVALSGDTLVVGALNESSSAVGVNGNQSSNAASGAGAAYVFVRSGSTWTQQAFLKASNTQAFDNFGHAVAIDGDTIVVSAIFESSNAVGINGNQSNNSAGAAGAVYVFVRVGSAWFQQAYIKASNTGASDNFGVDLALSGNTLVVGASSEDSASVGVNGAQGSNAAPESGAAYVFVRSGSTWSQQAYLKASNTESFDGFGFTVAVSGDTVLVGAGGEDSNANAVNGNQSNNLLTSAGAAYVFVRSGTTWSQQAYLKPANAGALDIFGHQVAIDGDVAVVASREEQSAATGINGDASDNSLFSAGAAYVFARTGSTWSQQAYVKPSNTSAGDVFAFAIDLSGDTLVASSLGEDSAATGVNGNEADESAPEAGAAYVYTVPCGQSSPYGTGCAGAGGFVPFVRATGCASGNGSLKVNVTSGLGGAPILFVLGTSSTSQPVGGACTLLVQPLFVVGGVALSGSGAGNGTLSIPASIPGNVVPGPVMIQVAVMDAASPIGAALSNGLQLDFE
jgi:hypothetical protein